MTRKNCEIASDEGSGDSCIDDAYPKAKPQEDTHSEAPQKAVETKSADYYYKESQNKIKYGQWGAYDLLCKAAELGHPEADYEIASWISYPTFDDENFIPFEVLISHLDVAVGNKHLGALHLQGELYLSGVINVSYEVGFEHTLIDMDERKALDCFTLAAVNGHPPSQFKLHEIYEDGTIVPQNYQLSFEWLKKAAYNRHIDAYPKLVKSYETGIFKNTEEAYIWALIANTTKASMNDRKAPARLEKLINDSKRILRLQTEANRRAAILSERSLSDHDLDLFTPPSPERIPELLSDDCPEPLADGADASLTPLPPLVVNDIKCLTITLYTNSNKVKLACGGSHHTLPAKELMSDNCHELLIRHDKHLNHQEPPVRYYESDIYDATKSRPRTNRQIVCDFNHALRKHLGLGKNIKPFVWIGRDRHRSLKANFTLKVDYKPQKQGKAKSM